VRKMLYDIFSADKKIENAKISDSQLVDQIENDIFYIN